MYSATPGFTFNLRSLTTDGKDLFLSPRDPRPDDLNRISARTTLDPTQAAAFMNTLLRELSMIQGPPGTGKSYTGEKLIRTLVANKKAGNLGPILCVCYTNHALDQLLEHLLDEGLDQLIRIGSRSKSERLESHNLRAMTHAMSRTKAEGRSLWDLSRSLERDVEEADRLLDTLSASGSWTSVKAFISTQYPHHHNELFGKDEDEFTQVTHHPKSVIKRWLKQGSLGQQRNRPVLELEHSRLAEMSLAERRKLYDHWLRSIRDSITGNLIAIHQSYNELIEQRNRVRTDLDLRCLQDVDVVGVTTTGLARNMHLLRKLRCKVLVCEEAGEVLEAHILTALLPSVEHAILIGDHLQLRPQIQNYDLQSTNPRGQQYSLDMSLFERLVQPPHSSDLRLPFSTLETQRRMHPSIANLIRSTLYPRLVDGGTVNSYPQVSGMKKRLFWLHHEHLEAGASSQDPTTTSHWNSFEIEMTLALVSHLVRQGEYGPEDIAVITPYLGQLLKLRRRMETMFEVCVNDRDQADLEAFDGESSPHTPPTGAPVAKTTLLKSVRVATVDNFQGEEAKVVVISLVRSNEQNRCGFLSTSNRINVLLSRAKHGMYLIGNANTYGHVSMWSEVIEMLKREGNFGTGLELQCPRHPEMPMFVSQPDQFLKLAPESGCSQNCDKRLQCGHRCHGRCHSEMLHAVVKCLEKCPRLKPGCEHVCPLECGVPCHDRCRTLLKDIYLVLPCGHVVRSAQCWEAQDSTKIKCKEIVKRTVPGCIHEVSVRCCDDVTANNFQCEAVCRHHQECGHACKSRCHQCRKRVDGKVLEENHGICTTICGRNYDTCRHSCPKPCHAGSACGLCEAPCDVRCTHSRCSKRCSDPCALCSEADCASRCLHSACTMPCAAPCDWVPCSKRCAKVLDCGHQCPSLCGEACPASLFCQQCGSEDVQSTTVDWLEMKQYREIDLDEDPCIFPDCGHFLTITSMDGQMNISAHYDMDKEGAITQVRASTEPFSMDGVKVCGSCRGPLRNIARYGRIVRRAMLDETTKKFISWSNREYLILAGRLVDEQQKLETASQGGAVNATAAALEPCYPKSRGEHMRMIAKGVSNHRYDSMLKFHQLVSKYARGVRKSEQPFQRVRDLVEYANRQNSSRAEFTFDESVIQLKGALLADNLLMKCEIIVLSDFLRRPEATQSTANIRLNLSTHLADCKVSIKLAEDAKYPRQQVEGHLFYAQLCGLARAKGSPQETRITEAVSSPPSETSSSLDSETEKWKITGLEHMAQARALIERYPSAAVHEAEVEAITHMLNDGIFYQQVSADELRVVYVAMESEFRGTGHWYRCEQGHPFTIGECGMPMQTARCPECNSPIGGSNHTAVEGVQQDRAIEELARGVRGLGV